MKKKRFLNIFIPNERNIGILSTVVTTKRQKDLSLKTSFNLREVELKLIKALSEHFSCEVTSLGTTADSVKSTAPLNIDITVFIKAEEEDKQVNVSLEEVYLY